MQHSAHELPSKRKRKEASEDTHECASWRIIASDGVENLHTKFVAGIRDLVGPLGACDKRLSRVHNGPQDHLHSGANVR